MAGEAAPQSRTVSVYVAPQGTAGTTQHEVVGAAPVAGTITGVVMIPDAAVTANATNYRTFQVINKGAAGSGSTVVASFATNVVTTNDLAAYVAKALVLNATPANLVVAAGDVLVANETVGASGVAHGGYKIEITIGRTAGS